MELLEEDEDILDHFLAKMRRDGEVPPHNMPKNCH